MVDSVAFTPTELRLLEVFVELAPSDKELARQLSLSERTVKNYIGIIYRKLGWYGTGSRVKLMKWAMERNRGGAQR